MVSPDLPSKGYHWTCHPRLLLYPASTLTKRAVSLSFIPDTSQLQRDLILSEQESVWRRFWRVAGSESGFPELLESPFPGLPRICPNFTRSSSATSPQPLSVDFKSNPEVPRMFPELSCPFLTLLTLLHTSASLCCCDKFLGFASSCSPSGLRTFSRSFNVLHQRIYQGYYFPCPDASRR